MKQKKLRLIFSILLICITCLSFFGCEKNSYNGLIDAFIDLPKREEVRILQLTDPQIIDSSQMRSPNRLSESLIEEWGPNGMETNCFRYIRQAIEKSDPHLIIVTGDLIYGEFDDAGTSLTAFIDFMDGFKIPWAPVFGNHDNESAKGVLWQCEQLENSAYCLFKRGNVTGNGNYCIGIRQKGTLVRTVYMMDSNGCSAATDYHVYRAAGFAQDQKNWLKNTAAAIKEKSGKIVPAILGFHIPVMEFTLAAQAAGYEPEFNNENVLYNIGIDVTAKNGDFGKKGEAYKGIHEEADLLNILKTNGFDGVFVGHSHLNNVSILYEGIRWTFGLKSSSYDRYSELGATLITCDAENDISVRHLYHQG